MDKYKSVVTCSRRSGTIVQLDRGVGEKKTTTTTTKKQQNICHVTHVYMLDQTGSNHLYRWIVIKVCLVVLFDRDKEIATSASHAGILMLFSM